jgi:hypothetical protein
LSKLQAHFLNTPYFEWVGWFLEFPFIYEVTSAPDDMPNQSQSCTWFSLPVFKVMFLFLTDKQYLCVYLGYNVMFWSI